MNINELLKEVLDYLRRGAPDNSAIYAIERDGVLMGTESRRYVLAIKVEKLLKAMNETEMKVPPCA